MACVTAQGDASSANDARSYASSCQRTRYGVAVNFVRFTILSLLLSPLAFVVACSGDDEAKPGSIHDAGSVGEAAAPLCVKAPDPVKPAASCEVTLESPPIAGASHVAEGTPIAYCSNPPSSGDHYANWADFQEYSTPVDWRYLVHSMEHGAVVLLYKCDPPGCPDIVEQLRAVRDVAAYDPDCTPGTKRIIIAPSPTIPTKSRRGRSGKNLSSGVRGQANARDIRARQLREGTRKPLHPRPLTFKHSAIDGLRWNRKVGRSEGSRMGRRT